MCCLILRIFCCRAGAISFFSARKKHVSWLGCHLASVNLHGRMPIYMVCCSMLTLHLGSWCGHTLHVAKNARIASLDACGIFMYCQPHNNECVLPTSVCKRGIVHLVKHVGGACLCLRERAPALWVFYVMCMPDWCLTAVLHGIAVCAHRLSSAMQHVVSCWCSHAVQCCLSVLQ